MKNSNNYSSAISESLLGRSVETNPAKSEKNSTMKKTSENEIIAEKSVENEKIVPSLIPVQQTDMKGNSDRGLGKNQDGTFKQTSAGRKKKSVKKVQVALTLSPSTKEELEKWAESKPRSATNYLSEYIDEHYEDIMNYYGRK